MPSIIARLTRLPGRIPPVTIVLAAALALVAPALLPGKVLSPADTIFSLPLYREMAPDGWVEPANPLLFDQVYQFTPWRHFAWESWRAGDIPLWNPHSSTGTPFVATMQAAVFYPVNLVTALVPFERAFVLSAVLRLWIAGISTYLLARHYGLDRVPSVVPALSFSLGSFVTVWLGHPHANVAVWLPALILAAELLARAETRQDLATGAGALAAITGIQFTGGHIETSADILFAAGVYFIVRLVQRTWATRGPWVVDWRSGSRALTFLAGLSLGTGIAAIQLLPFLEWLPLSAEYQLRSQDGFTLLDPVFLKNLVALPLALVPNLYNNPTWAQPYWSFNPWGNYNESALYAGVIPLLLAVIGSLVRWRDAPVVRAWVAVGLLMLAMALQLPVFDWLNQIPGRSLAHPNRLRLIVIFAVAVLAGFGMQSIMDADRQVALRLLERGLLAVVALYALLFVLGGVLLPRFDGDMSDRLQYEAERWYPDPASRPRSVTLCVDRMGECVQDVEDAFAWDRLAMYVPGLLAMTLLIGLHIPKGSAFTPTLIIGLTATELLITSAGYNPVIRSEDFYPEPELLSGITREPGQYRTTALGQLSYPDSQMMHGLSDVRGLDFPTAWYDDYLNATGERIPWLANGVLLETTDSPLTRLLNIRYVIATSETVAADDQLRPVARQGDLVLADLVSPQPRAFTVNDAVIVEYDADAARLLGESPEIVLNSVVLQDSPEARAALSQVSGDERSTGSVTLLDYEAERSRWRVQSDQPSLLVVSDAYYPGWKATIDGEPAHLFRANLAFRAVLVGAGDHTVEFHYEPRSFQLGSVITLCSLLVTARLLAYPLLSRRLNRGSD